MRSVLLFTIAVSLSVVAVPRAADDLVTSRFSDYLDALRNQAGIPGLAVALVRPEGTWEHTFGQQDVEHALPVQGDTPFHLDGTTQIVAASIILRCVEEGYFRLDDAIGHLNPTASEPNATVRQILSHTSGPPDALVYAYRPDRLNWLAPAMSECAGRTFRGSIAEILNRFAMFDSVPGPDVVTLPPPADGMTPAAIARYTDALQRLAKPYSSDARGRPAPSQYLVTTLSPAAGLIGSVRDLERFDGALRTGAIIRADSLTMAWTAALDKNGGRLPHGLGWFVQSYNGERIVWQFGVQDNASSSLVITVPGRAMTLVMVANSQGLSRPFALSAGDVTVSPFARTFLSLFIR